MVLATFVRGWAADATEAIPELERLRAPYQKNLQLIAAEQEAHAKPIADAYLAALDRLAKDLTARKDPSGPMR